MESAWRFDIRSSLDGDWLKLPPRNIGGQRLSRTADHFILADGPHKIRFDLRLHPEDPPSAISAISWKNWFAFGAGGRVFLFRPSDDWKDEIDLHSYFDAFWPLAEALLIISGRGIIRLNPDGGIQWRNVALGVDGVKIHRVTEDIIHGSSTWDPPNDWRDFAVSIASGRAV